MTDQLTEWQREAAARAERAVEPVLLCARHMAMREWHGFVDPTTDPEIAQNQPDYVAPSDGASVPVLQEAQSRLWHLWQLRHGNDLYITFRPPPGDNDRPMRFYERSLWGPFTPDALDAILKGRRIRADGDVPQRFMAHGEVSDVPPFGPAGTPPPPEAAPSDSPAPATTFRRWFTYVALFVIFSTLGDMLLDGLSISVNYVLGWLVFAVVLAGIFTVLRPDGPRDPSKSDRP